MRINTLSVWLILTIMVLAACTGSRATTPIIPPTLAVVSETPGATMQPLTPTETATLAPTSTETPIPQVTLEAVGDIMLGRTVGDQVLAQGPQVVFAGVQSVLDSADILVGNLECAITDLSQPEHKNFTLRAPPETAQALSQAGFDVLSLANNHAMDYGYAGLSDMQSTLKQYGISTVGAGSDGIFAHTPVVIERNGLRLAFLAYADVTPENSGFDAHTWIATTTAPGIAWADPVQIKADVTAAKLKADVVIVLLHSGYEINSTVSINQRTEAHAAIDAGAALVIGSHPHILQGIEPYHGGLIAFSLGNFVFDQYNGIVNATIILRVVLDRSGVVSYDYVPVLIENGLPVVTSIDNVRGIETLVAPVSP
jgi:poly-gamma-glutamate capsule biosynthesis protein CapA/YwtB (metallophosphatase superfamily)